MCKTRTGLHCEIYGAGDPLLFLHGFGASSYTWRNLIEPLKDEYQVILIDLKGFGSSPKPRDRRYSIQDQAQLIYEFILENDLKHLTLIGNSFGGAVSLMLAIKLCEDDRSRIAKLILIDSAGYKDSIPWHVKLLSIPFLGWLSISLLPRKLTTRRVLRYVYYNESLITREQIAIYSELMRSSGAKYALRMTARQAIPKNADELVSKYKSICVPTLILWGEHDKVIPPKIGKRLNRDIPGSRFVQLPETGHAPQEEAPARTIPIILEFLGKPTT